MVNVAGEPSIALNMMPRRSPIIKGVIRYLPSEDVCTGSYSMIPHDAGWGPGAFIVRKSITNLSRLGERSQSKLRFHISQRLIDLQWRLLAVVYQANLVD